MHKFDLILLILFIVEILKFLDICQNRPFFYQIILFLSLFFHLSYIHGLIFIWTIIYLTGIIPYIIIISRYVLYPLIFIYQTCECFKWAIIRTFNIIRKETCRQFTHPDMITQAITTYSFTWTGIITAIAHFQITFLVTIHTSSSFIITWTDQ